jgi:hypothetical protein
LSRVVQLRLSGWQHEYLGALGDRWGVGTNEAIRRLVEEQLVREEGKGAEAVRAFFERQAVGTDGRSQAKMVRAIEVGELDPDDLNPEDRLALGIDVDPAELEVWEGVGE